jgi:hypothetical protein
MNPPAPLRTAPFVLAVAVAIIVVLSAPFVGQLRSWVRANFPGQFVSIAGVTGGVALLGVLTAAVVRIRQRRAQRYGTIALALAIAAAYSVFNAGTNPESNVVERFHFLEYGLITFLFYRAWRPLEDVSILLLPMLAGLIVGTTEEWLQWFVPRRVGEIRDIFLNLVAIGCGLLFSVAVQPPERFVPVLGRGSLSRVCRLAAAAVFALAIFVHVVHLGYVIEDPEAGRFTSRYSAERLHQLQVEKSAQWRVHPPPRTVNQVSREDQYLSEGIEHVMERNERWTAGDIRAAWHENLILEKHFPLVLDTPTYAGLSGHRWPPEQRADAEQRLKSAGDDSTRPVYVSEAYPYRILTWNRGIFWGVAAVVIGSLIAIGSRRRA